MSHKRSHKLIRDPLYGFVLLNGLELGIIDLPIFRRLQFIKQLSHTYVAYPSAIHTRFEHLLGTMHVSGMMSKELCFDEAQIQIVRLACLLHDIGHGPFSHLFEHVMEKANREKKNMHEEISRIMIREDSDIDGILKSYKDDVLELLSRSFTSEKSSTKSILADVVSSGLDADKLDYLRRDSYHIGVRYGDFDFARIIHSIDSAKTTSNTSSREMINSKICIGIKGKDALESYRLARYLMHVQVYEHHARLSADQMFLRALEIAIHEESIIDENQLKIKSNNNDEFLRYYASLNDFSIYEMITKNPKSKTSKEILQNILNRKLLKRSCEFVPNSLDNAIARNLLLKLKPDEYEEISSGIAEKLKIPPHEVIFYKSEITNKLYKSDQLFCKLADDNVAYLDEVSPITGKNTIKFYVFGPPDQEKRKKIAVEMSKELGVDVEKITAVGT